MKQRLISLALALALFLGLTVPAAAAGSYAPYTINGTAYDGSAYTISFSAATIEEKTVQIRDKLIHAFGDPDEISSYRNEHVVFVVLKPGSAVSMSLSDVWGPFSIREMELDGNDQFTIVEHEFSVREADEGLLKSDLETGASMLEDIGGVTYIVVYEDRLLAASSGFTDVKSDDYYADAIKWAVDQGITAGTSPTTFSPEQTCTVAQILTFLWRANGSPRQTGGNPFRDVSSSDYYYDAALWAHSKGLVSGNKFNPDAACTRAMTVTYLWKLAGSPDRSRAEYGAQTIAGVVFDGTPCQIEFSAATLENVTIAKAIYDIDTDTTAQEREQVALISVAPGSKMTVSGVPEVSLLHYIKEDGGYSDPGPRGSTEMSSAVLVGGADEIAGDAACLHFHGTAWEIMDFKSESGIPYLIDMGSETVRFTDVPATADYAQAVAWAVENGITSGSSAAAFSPNATCTRGQIVTFLYRAMD